MFGGQRVAGESRERLDSVRLGIGTLEYLERQGQTALGLLVDSRWALLEGRFSAGSRCTSATKKRACGALQPCAAHCNFMPTFLFFFSGLQVRRSPGSTRCRFSTPSLMAGENSERSSEYHNVHDDQHALIMDSRLSRCRLAVMEWRRNACTSRHPRQRPPRLVSMCCRGRSVTTFACRPYMGSLICLSTRRHR